MTAIENPTPRDMLKLYRASSHPFTDDQKLRFMAMPASERMELLFYMLMNTNVIVQMLHEKIEPGAAPTQSMPPVPRGH